MVGPNVEINDDTIIHTHVNITGNTKIGKKNDAGDDMDSVSYYEMETNMDYMNENQSQPKRAFIKTDNMWLWIYKFSDIPIKIMPNKKFGHLIQGDFNNGQYATDPVGIIQGFMYQ